MTVGEKEQAWHAKLKPSLMRIKDFLIQDMFSQILVEPQPEQSWVQEIEDASLWIIYVHDTISLKQGIDAHSFLPPRLSLKSS